MRATACRVVVAAAAPSLFSAAQALGKRLDLPVLTDLIDPGEPICSIEHNQLLLIVTLDGLKLKDLRAAKESPVWVDFTVARLRMRSQQAGAAKQSLAKAVGVKPGWRPAVIDATAGLGRDAFVLASLGCHVTLLERHPVVAELLKDGIKRALLHPDTAEVMRTGIKFIAGQAASIIRDMAESQCADVIYLDPMFPHREKSARVKKEMRLFQTLVGEDEDVSALLDAALQFARKRVVVKRPSRAETLSKRTPHLVITGKSTRYDIYFTHQ